VRSRLAVRTGHIQVKVVIPPVLFKLRLTSLSVFCLTLDAEGEIAVEATGNSDQTGFDFPRAIR